MCVTEKGRIIEYLVFAGLPEKCLAPPWPDSPAAPEPGHAPQLSRQQTRPPCASKLCTRSSAHPLRFKSPPSRPSNGSGKQEDCCSGCLAGTEDSETSLSIFGSLRIGWQIQNLDSCCVGLGAVFMGCDSLSASFLSPGKQSMCLLMLAVCQIEARHKEASLGLEFSCLYSHNRVRVHYLRHSAI